jgi:two-component system response regulator FixJ
MPMSGPAHTECPEPEPAAEGRRAPAWIHLVGAGVTSRADLSLWMGARGYRTRLHASPESLVAAVPWLEPGCIVLDLAGPVWGALEEFDRVRTAAPDHPLVVCGCGNVALAVAAMKLGAANVLDRPVSLTALTVAVGDALEVSSYREAPPPPSTVAKTKVATLTPRQRDVLGGVMAGKPNKIIAHELGLSSRTVEGHRATLMMRTGAGCLSSLIRIGVSAGL